MGNRENSIPPFLLLKPQTPSIPPFARGGQPAKGGRLRARFIEKGLAHVAEVISTGYSQWELASGKGFLQKLDARIKVLLLAFFIVIISLKKEIAGEAVLLCFTLSLAALSRIGMLHFLRRALFFGFIFGFLVALPSSLNVLARGEIMLPLIELPGSYDLWIYHIPARIGFTREGLLGVAMLTLRVVNSISLSLLIVSTTPFPEIVKALKMFRVPDAFLIMLTLSYKYIFIFSKTVGEMYLGKKSRLAGEAGASDGRKWVAGRIGFIFRKTQARCEDVFKAMLARGFAGSVRLYGFRGLAALDWAAGIVFFCAGCIFLIL